jgi:hypothetical protein
MGSVTGITETLSWLKEHHYFRQEHRVCAGNTNRQELTGKPFLRNNRKGRAAAGHAGAASLSAARLPGARRVLQCARDRDRVTVALNHTGTQVRTHPSRLSARQCRVLGRTETLGPLAGPGQGCAWHWQCR